MGWLARLRSTLLGTRRASEIAEEAQFHLDQRALEHEHAGSTPEHARLEARRRFGSVALTASRTRDADVIAWLDTLLRDIRHALRLLSRTPAVSLAAIVSLALGIGASSALFSVLDAVVLRKLTVEEPDRLVEVRSAGTERHSGPLWRALRDAPPALDGLFAWGANRIHIGDAGETEFAQVQYVSGSYFPVLGIDASPGRLLSVEDDRRGGGPGGPATVISRRLWMRRYQGGSDAIGRTIFVGGQPFTIVGVTPASFGSLNVGREPDLYLPLETEPLIAGRDSYLDHWYSRWLSIGGRLPAGETRERAASRLNVLMPDLRTLLPQSWSADERRNHLRDGFVLEFVPSGISSIRTRYGAALFALLPVVGLVLLIACANVANLLLARAETRRHELAVRLSIGASGAQLVRQLLTESLVLALLGGIAGLLVARTAARLLASQLSTRLAPVTLDVAIDGRVLGFTLAVTLATAVIFGIAPALRAARLSPLESFQPRGAADRQRRLFGISNGLVAAQIALSLVLVIGAALFTRSFVRLATLDVGFDRQAVLLADLDLRRSAVPPESRHLLYGQILDAARATPDVAAVAAGINTPASGWMWNTGSVRIGGPHAPVTRGDLYVNAVSPGWFETLRTPRLAGRDFDVRDAPAAPRVAIVNEAFVRTFLPAGGSPLGQLVAMGEGPEDQPVIVGVVGDAIYRRPHEPVPPTLYIPLAQVPRPRPSFSLIVRPRTDLARAATALRHAVAAQWPELALDLRTLDAQFDDSLVQERMLAGVSGYLGGLGLVLAAVGLYGVMSFSVARRTRELGIRLALGASPRTVRGLVLRQVLALTTGGLLAGAFLSLLFAKAAGSLLVALDPRDPVTWAVSIAALGATAIAAGYLPARRASRIDPATSLRDGQ